MMTNSWGMVIPGSEGTFLPYGEEYVPTTSGNHYKFTGKERDAETNLDYFGARYYGSKMGRWLTPDWSESPTPVPYADLSEPQSLNLYGYVGNRPILHFDLDGHCWPVSECAAWVQQKVETATAFYETKAATSGNWFVAGGVRTAGDVLSGTADSFNAGASIGSCLDSCNAVQMGDAAGQDIGRAAGLLAMAAGGGEAALEKITQRTLTKAATEAAETVGPGRGGAHGTRVHSQFEENIKATKSRSDLSTEVSYKNGEVVPRGTPGSVRVDVVRGNPARPSAAYDLKTGSAKLTNRRKAQIQRHLPGKTTIKEIRPATK